MFEVRRYCVQAYERRAGALARGEVLELRWEEEARSRAALMRRRVAGVAVYAVRGWPMLNVWDEPRLLWSEGEVLPVEAAYRS